MSDLIFDTRQTARRSVSACDPVTGARMTVFAVKVGSAWGPPELDLSQVAWSACTRTSWQAIARFVERTFAEYERRFPSEQG